MKSLKLISKFLSSKPQKGFSLVETLIAVLIFSLAAVIITQTFGSLIKSYVTAKKSQSSAENAQYALNLMEKTIRTSTIKTANSTGILDFSGADTSMLKLFDNSQSRCMAYRFSSNKIEKLTKPTTDKDISSCGDFVAGYDVSDLTSSIVESMKVKGEVSSVGRAGKVSVSLAVREPGLINPLNVAMTVSLRNFDPLVAAAPVPAPIPSCSDGVKNGTETGVDCGGSCSACAVTTCSIATAPNYTGICGPNGLSKQLATGCTFSLGEETSTKLTTTNYTCQSDGTWRLKSTSTGATASTGRDIWTDDCGNSSLKVLTCGWTWVRTGSFYNGDLVCQDDYLPPVGACTIYGETRTVNGCYWDGTGADCPAWACDRTNTYTCK